MKTYSYDEVLKKERQDPDFRKAYDETEEEFTVVKEIIQLRLAQGLTQRELAKRACTSQPAIARLESGNYRNVSLSFLRKLGAALGAVPVVHMQPIGTSSHQHA